MTDRPSDGTRQSSRSRDLVLQIKVAAIRQIEALDSRVRIHSTDYFNHTFAPDLVLRWRDDPAQDRYVYLRGTGEPQYLAEDVDRIGNQHPIVVGLEPLQGGIGDDQRDRLTTTARTQDTLVTDTTAIRSLAEAKRERPVTSLLSTALTQGGRGVVDDDQARGLTATVVAGFEGAQRMGAESVVQASAALEEHLAAPFAARFGRLLQAVWIGSGGRSDLFPVESDLSGAIDNEALEFLLDLEPIDDLEFWYRLGRKIELDQIGRLRLSQPNANLQHLVTANLDHLWARVCHVRDDQTQLDEEDAPLFWWRIERNALTLRSATWVAFIAEKAERLESIPGTQTDGVTVEDIRRRARDVRLTGLQLTDGRDILDLASLVNADVVHGERLMTLTQTFGGGARVRRATAALRDGRQLRFDFTKSSASVVTRSTALVSELLGVALPLLRPMSDEDFDALREVLRAAGGPEQTTLFSSLNEEDVEEELDEPLF